KAEYMSVPRMCALAEVVWSRKEVRDWGDFKLRLERHFARLDAMGVNYCRSSNRVAIRKLGTAVGQSPIFSS
ncbi:MAG: hypothetical protein OEY25_15995, partial [Candidatus Aminicenantes bacterium]|nr:hypothetical protein [Candidatus Aminicenantes bacterium]